MDNEIQNLYRVIDKLDTAIDKLADVSSDIKQILAVHEARLDQAEGLMERHFVQMDAVHSRISSLRDDMARSEREIIDRIDVIEKWKWQVIGVASGIGLAVSFFVQMMFG